jgi:hypothetical protein
MEDGKTTSSTYQIDKLNETNYRSWSRQLEAILDEKDLLEIVEGMEKRPERMSPTTAPASATDQTLDVMIQTSAEYEAKLSLYTKNVKKAGAIIISSITASVMAYVEGMKDPSEIWKTLERKYNPKTMTTLLQIMKEFMAMKMEEGEDVEAHLQKVIRLKRRVEEQGEKVSETVYNGILLNSVPESYKTTVRILEASGKLTPEEIINGILEEYRKIGKEDAGKLKMAMLTNTQGQPDKNQNGKSKKKNSARCFHCNKRNHKEAKCWIKHPELKPSDAASNSKSSQAQVSMMAIGKSHTENATPDKWYLDSGASQHFSPYKGLFDNIEEFEEPQEIETSDGTTVYGIGKGPIQITVVADKETIPTTLTDVPSRSRH